MQKTLPRGWKLIKLGEMCEIYQPQTITAKEIKNEGPYKVYGANGVIGFYDKYNHEDSEVLVTCRGATCGTVNFSEPKSWITGNSMVIHPKTKDIDKKFLYRQFQYLNLLRTITGTAQPQITRVPLMRLPILIPPLPTQHKIVEILEETDNLRKLRQQADEKMKDLIPSLFVQIFGDPATNPKGWEIKKLGNVCIKVTDGSHRTPKLLDSGYPFLTVANIGEGKFKYIDVKYISEFDYKDLVKNDCKPLKGDVLFSKDGTIGKVLVINKEEPLVILSSIAILRPNQAILNPIYLAKITESDFVVNQAKNLQSGSALRRIILKSLKTAKIPLPPLPLQQEFAKLVEDIETEKTRQAESKKKLDELFNSLMQRAFTGELVA
jgi:type I restriction enzyme S subunit